MQKPFSWWQLGPLIGLKRQLQSHFLLLRSIPQKEKLDHFIGSQFLQRIKYRLAKMTNKLSNSDKSPKYQKKTEYKRKICEASRPNDYTFFAEIKCY